MFLTSIKFYIISLSFYILLVSTKVQSTNQNTPPPIPIDWYDCSGKSPGRYMHFIDCTKYIVCTEEGNAFEIRCPNCATIQPHLCPHGRLVFNDEVKLCFPAALAKCKIDTETPWEPPGQTTTESSRPTTKTTTGVPSSTTATPPRPSSTTGHPPTMIPPDPDLPKPGGDCDPQQCTNIGYGCQSYLRCGQDTSQWFVEYCGSDLFWNPLNPNGTQQLHGGNCDLLENIPPNILRKYEEDPECSL